jgi:HlyD family secretion protein
MNKNLKTAITSAILLVTAAGAFLLWGPLREKGLGEGFVSGNGRIEATEIAVATKLAGRVEEIMVAERDFVKAGQPLARMQIESLQAQREEALARLQQAVSGAEAEVALRESDYQAALAAVAQRESDLDTAQRRLPRSEKLAQEGFFSGQLLDDDRAKVRSLQAAVICGQVTSQGCPGRYCGRTHPGQWCPSECQGPARRPRAVPCGPAGRGGGRRRAGAQPG